jgi:hypothetical protein
MKPGLQTEHMESHTFTATTTVNRHAHRRLKTTIKTDLPPTDLYLAERLYEKALTQKRPLRGSYEA